MCCLPRADRLLIRLRRSSGLPWTLLYDAMGRRGSRQLENLSNGRRQHKLQKHLLRTLVYVRVTHGEDKVRHEVAPPPGGRGGQIAVLPVPLQIPTKAVSGILRSPI
jgi:hypothetical protein